MGKNQAAIMDFFVGTFNLPAIYKLRFEPDEARLTLKSVYEASGGHSWLSFSPDKKKLYCTTWTEPLASISAYSISENEKTLIFINNASVSGRPGYVCASKDYIYTVGGATGEVFRVREDGGVGELVQKLSFQDPESASKTNGTGQGEVPHGDFGGLRHGAHSCDISPDGRSLYVADIGRNCVWVYGIAPANESRDEAEVNLRLEHKDIAPRSNDGPRHSWPHPNGKVLYSLQEHSNMVDAFQIERNGTGAVENLQHRGAVSILPSGEAAEKYWADEVRLSSGPDPQNPKFLYASTRGLVKGTQGYVSVFALNEDGTFASETPIDIWKTPTSGGIANAVEPAPCRDGKDDGIQYLALTDSEEGLVMVLSFDGKGIEEVGRIVLPMPQHLSGDPGKKIAQAATAVWL